ncbi:MAG: mucoidy inhibitor MuiA family protein [Promethearchaeota archaeon]
MENEKKNLDMKIDNVIIYQTGVQIAQLGAINLSEGEHLISITDLPASLDKESIRIKGSGNGRIINIMIEYNSKKEIRKEKHQQLQEQKEKIEKEMNQKQNDINRLKEQIAKYKNTEDNFYSNWAKAFSFGEVAIDNFINFNQKLNELIAKKNEKIDQFEDRIKDLRAELQVVNNKIYSLGPVEKITNFYEVILNLNANQEGEFKIELRFTLTQAWWVPFYDIALTEGDARLTMMANIFNRTGLDWENVEIEISTASLSPIALIKPSPIYLREDIPYDYRKRKKSKAPMRRLAAKPMEKGSDIKEKEIAISDEEYAPEPEPEIRETYAEVSEHIGVQSFKIPNRISIPSDMNPHPVNLTVQELESKKKYFWSSAAPENVIIRDKLKNRDLLLLAGNVKIYYMEEFLGETSIPVIAPKEEFKLGTRVTYDLKIDKKLIDRSKAKKAIKGKLRNDYEYKIVIKNLNEVEEELTLMDRIPHSSHENIRVEVVDMPLEPDKKELGVLKWNLSLKGIKEKTIIYKYYIEYKKDIHITPPLP